MNLAYMYSYGITQLSGLMSVLPELLCREALIRLSFVAGFDSNSNLIQYLGHALSVFIRDFLWYSLFRICLFGVFRSLTTVYNLSAFKIHSLLLFCTQ